MPQGDRILRTMYFVCDTRAMRKLIKLQYSNYEILHCDR